VVSTRKCLRRPLGSKQILQSARNPNRIEGRRSAAARPAGRWPELNRLRRAWRAMSARCARLSAFFRQTPLRALSAAWCCCRIVAVWREARGPPAWRSSKLSLRQAFQKTKRAASFEGPAHPQDRPVEITQQQVCLAENALQLQGHEQFPPLRTRVSPWPTFRIKAAGQLWVKLLPPFSTLRQHVGDQGPGRPSGRRRDAPEATSSTASKPPPAPADRRSGLFSRVRWIQGYERAVSAS